MTELPTLSDVDCSGRIVLVPTAHVSPESADRVESTIEHVDPDIVAVELDEERAEKYSNDEERTILNVSELVDGEASFCGASISMLHRAGTLAALENLERAMSDSDMITAMRAADEQDIPHAYIDQSYEVTRERLVSECAPVELVPVIAALSLTYVSSKLWRGDPEEFAEETMIERNQFTESSFPKDIVFSVLGMLVSTPKRVIRDERDSFMAEKLDSIADEDTSIVTVIGAAHWNGIRDKLREKGHNPITVWPNANDSEE